MLASSQTAEFSPAPFVKSVVGEKQPLLPTKMIDGESLQDGLEASRERLPLVRVKRKLGLEPVDSLWLEVSTRPSKRRELENSLLRLQGLQLGDAGGESAGQAAVAEGRGEEGATRKLFRRLETVTPAHLASANTSEQLFRLIEAGKKRSAEARVDRRPDVHKERQEQLLSKAREEHKAAARSARFEQVQQRRRSGRGEASSEDDAMAGLFQLYDVVRVDRDEVGEARRAERREKAKRERDAAAAEGKLLCNYMPLLLEHVPKASADIEQHLASLNKTRPADGIEAGEEEEEGGIGRGPPSGQSFALPNIRDVFGPPRKGPDLGALPLPVDMRGERVRPESKPQKPLLLLEYKPYVADVVPRPLTGTARGGDGNASDTSEEDCVYDLYCMEEDALPGEDEAAGTHAHPVVQVVEDEYEEYLSDISEYDSEDSNAENNPQNDYPDEEDGDGDSDFDEGHASMLRNDRSIGEGKIYFDSDEEYDTMIDDDSDGKDD